ncbi:hypothetical protein OH76DRAFT_1491250 [Lentinus brumalis]|uniref:Uncharacterized protein n=1 Tax=Lentinus brumalis TaxID=2498619 RepID=A0A371CGH4_9APHY|nr:hypothetical protein OH76DRAFT_1491250 [Polyporus brumalis]
MSTLDHQYISLPAWRRCECTAGSVTVHFDECGLGVPGGPGEHVRLSLDS